jgi:hypothetical protein
MEPYQKVPLDKNVAISIADAVVVIVGAVPFGHLTPVKVAVLLPVASWLTIKINDCPAVTVGIVKVQFPVRVTV